MDVVINGFLGVVVCGVCGLIGFIIGFACSIRQWFKEMRREKSWQRSEMERLARDVWRKSEVAE